MGRASRLGRTATRAILAPRSSRCPAAVGGGTTSMSRPCPRYVTTSAPASPRPHLRQLPSTGFVRFAMSPLYFGPGPGIFSCGATHQDPLAHSSPPVEIEWEHFVQADIERRQKQKRADSGLVSSSD